MDASPHPGTETSSGKMTNPMPWLRGAVGNVRQSWRLFAAVFSVVTAVSVYGIANARRTAFDDRMQQFLAEAAEYGTLRYRNVNRLARPDEVARFERLQDDAEWLYSNRTYGKTCQPNRRPEGDRLDLLSQPDFGQFAYLEQIPWGADLLWVAGMAPKPFVFVITRVKGRGASEIRAGYVGFLENRALVCTKRDVASATLFGFAVR